MYFKNKKIWITGASSGIGEALTYAFANEDAEIVISSRKKDQLEKVKSNCKDPNRIHIVTIDVAKHDEVPNKANEVLAKMGDIDILINNAGVSQRALVKDTKFEVDKRLIDINYLGTVAVTKSILNSMIQQQSGQIIVMSSLVGKFGSPLRSSYAAAKHALHGFFESLRAEVHDHNISITMICPGYIKTDISKNALTGSGDKQNKMDQAQDNGLSTAAFSKQALAAIRKQKREVYIGGKEVAGIYIARFFPALFSKIIKKVAVT